MNAPKLKKQDPRKKTTRKYSEPLDAEISIDQFDEFVARIVRVKPDKKSVEWKKTVKSGRK